MRISSPRAIRGMVTAAIVVLGLEGGLASAEGGPQDCGPFAPPRRVTDGTGLATQTATGLDVANNAYIASVINERIQVKIIGPSLDADVPVAAAGLAQGDPDFATTSTGITYMSFSQLDESTPGDGREIYLTNNEGGGGKFKTPTKISKNPLDDYAPRLVLDLQGKPQLAWAQSVGQSVGEAAQSRVCYWNASLPAQEPVVAASGDYPHLYVDEADVVHLVYSRDKDLYYNNNRGGAFTNEKRVTTTANDPESAASIGGDPSGNILIAYESRYSLYYVTKPPLAEFRPPVLVDAGGILDPRMRVRSRGQVTIVYAKQGDIYYVVGQSTFLSSPERICAHTEAVESRPSLEIDLAGVTHLSYIRDGEVWYTNNASQPVAEFAAIPTIGEVPLTVKFGDLSSGGIEVWEWDFGDGATSLEQNPAHTYTDPGKYKVKLTVSGSGGTQAIKEKEDFIFVQDPYYTMRIPDQLVIPGQENVWFPVITTRKDKTQGFQIRATYDPNYLIFKGSDFSYAVLPTSKPPDLIVVNTIGTSSLEVGCIYELPEPFDPANQFLPPGQNQAILQFIFDVSSGAPQGAKTQVDLVNNRSVSMILNIFIVNGLSKIPALTGSTVEILVVEPPYPRYFLRGDADNNGTLDLTDAVKILNYLFTGGNPPVCLDAADVNDRGKVDISSAVALLNFLFLGGPPPAVPFPNAGLDPTPDSFPDCL